MSTKHEGPDLIDATMAEIRAYQLYTGMSDQRLSLHACANNYAVVRVREGGATFNTAQQIIDYIRAFPNGPRGFMTEARITRRDQARKEMVDKMIETRASRKK